MDKKSFEDWSGSGCSNSYYVVLVTTCCGAFVVEDLELGDLYCNPDDARNVVKTWETGNCPLCGAESWDCVEPHAKDMRSCAWLALGSRSAT